MSKIKIILLQNYPKLGNKWTVADVSLPLFQNVLLPKWIAKKADSNTLNNIAQQEQKKQNDHKKMLDWIQSLIEKLKDWLEIFRQVDSSWHLYAKIDEKEINQEIFSKFKFRLPKDTVKLEKKIEKTWEYKFTLVFETIKSNINLAVKPLVWGHKSK